VTSAPDAAARIVDVVLAAPPTLGSGRLVCVDGPAGSGKTTLASSLARGFASRDVGTRVLHMDDVYDGWTGLSSGMATMATVVGALRDGRPGRYRRYDWYAGAYAEEHVVQPVDVLLVEGVGSGGTAYDDTVTCLVWVDTPSDVRLRRGLERDGDGAREQWVAWCDLESLVFERERTSDRADVVVDGQTGMVRK
jgi:uridine kinase